MRILPVLATTLVFTLGFAGGAAAQLTVTVADVEGRGASERDLTNPPVGSAECAFDPAVDFRITGLDGTGRIIDIWRGTGSTDCSVTTNRAADTRVCDPITLSQDQGISDTTLMKDLNDVPLSELISCDTNEGQYGIWFLVSNAVGSTEDVTLYGSTSIEIDKTPPTDPSGLGDATGNTMASVSWSGTEPDDFLEYRVYGDPGSRNVAGCDAVTSVLMEGAQVPDGMVLLANPTGKGATINPTELTLEEGEAGAMVVVSVDQAGNESNASNVACVERVPTSGFCDAYGDCEQGCSVSKAAGAPNGRSAAGVLLLVSGAMLFGRRRWRR